MINRQRLIKLTQKLIRINSENPPGNEKEIVSFLRDYLVGFGLKSRTYEFAKGRPNLIAQLRASDPRAKTILISPHLDTVPAGKGWKFPPFKGVIKDGRLYGRGATDCKCNLAAAIEALNSLVEDRPRIANHILFAATADEESGSGLGLIPLLKKGILKADYALILDSDEFEIIIAQKGLIHFTVSVSGKKAHGAYPDQGVNAINIACGIIRDLEKYKFSFQAHPLLKCPTINAGTIHGGDKVNMVADWCDFELDLRYLPGMSAKDVLADLKRLIAKRASRYAGKIKIDGIQAPYEIDKRHILPESLLKCWRGYSKSAGFKGSEGATVITFFKEIGIPAVATGFGSRGCAHINDEYVRIDNLFRGAQALEEFLRGEIK